MVDHLELTTITGTQSNKYVASNDGDSELVDALAGSVDVEISTTSPVDILKATYLGALEIVLVPHATTPPTAAFTVDFEERAAVGMPAEDRNRGIVIVRNTTDEDATLQVDSQVPAGLVLPAGKANMYWVAADELKRVSDIAADDLDINGLSSISSVEGDSDWLVVHDTSAGGIRKIKPDDLGVGGGGGGGYSEVSAKDFGAGSAATWDVNVTGYRELVVLYEDVGYTASDTLSIRVSTDGSTFDSGATDYSEGLVTDTTQTENDQTYMPMQSDAATSSGEIGRAYISNVDNATYKTQMVAFCGNVPGGGLAIRRCHRKTAQADTHIRILTASGSTINAGKIVVLGLGAAAGSEWNAVVDDSFTAVSSRDFDISSVPSGAIIRVELLNIDMSADDNYLGWRISTDNGSTFKSGASDYEYGAEGNVNGADSIQSSPSDALYFTNTTGGTGIKMGGGAGENYTGTHYFTDPNDTTYPFMLFDGRGAHMTSDGSINFGSCGGYYTTTGSAITDMRVIASAGTFDGRIVITYKVP